MKKFLVGVVWFANGTRSAHIFVNKEEADEYYSKMVADIVRWVLIDYEFGKATLIHDCAGDGIYKKGVRI